MFFRYTIFLFFLLLMIAGCQLNSQSSENDWKNLIGQPAPAWNIDQWINSEKLTLEDLKGKVILLRWWTEGCHYCIASADTLNEFHKKYQADGLTIIGMYHPKPYPERIPKHLVELFVKEKNFQFPIALDNHWKTLFDYWLQDANRSFTSVSFLLDKDGVIRYIHPGGEYHKDGEREHAKCKTDFYELEDAIVKLLREK